MYWRLDGPTTDADALRATLKAIKTRLHGDGAVTNPSTLMRVGGTVAWPKKDGRVAEMTALIVCNDDGPESYTLEALQAAFAEKTQDTSLDFDLGGGGRTDAEIDALLEATRQPHEWHTNMLAATASLIGRGETLEDIRQRCGPYCDHGETDPELAELIESAVRKFASERDHETGLPKPDTSILVAEVLAPSWEDAYLPAFWARYVRDTADAKNAPPDFVAVPLLAAASALIGNARWAKPYAASDWLEMPNLWLATVGLPGTGKSPAAKPVFDTVAAVERERLPDFENRYADYLRDLEEFKGREDIWRGEVKQAVKDGLTPPDLQAVEPVKPVEPCLMANDATLEKLCLLLQAEPKGLLYRRDELAGWLENMNRYGAGNDRPFWLEAWSGGSYVQHRIKYDKPIRIDRLALSVFGTTQPERVTKMLAEVDDGLIGRFLWSKPDRVPFAPPRVAADNEAATAALRRLANLKMDTREDGELAPRLVPFAPRAEAVLTAFAIQMDERQDTANGLMMGTISKARGQAVRLALVLTYLDWAAEGGPEPTEVSEVLVVSAANMLADYFMPMARRVFKEAALPEAERDAATIAHWLKKHPEKQKVNASAMERGKEDGFFGLRNRQQIDAALSVLTDHKILMTPKAEGKAGRPRVDFYVNPRFREDT